MKSTPANSRIPEYLVVCYAVHDKHIVSCDGFNDFNEAVRFLEEDAKNVHREELMNNDKNATIDFYEGTAKVTSCGDYIWTWEIVTVSVLNEVSKEEN